MNLAEVLAADVGREARLARSECSLAGSYTSAGDISLTYLFLVVIPWPICRRCTKQLELYSN